MSDDLFLESNEYAQVKSIAGKEVTEVKDHEVAVSSAYAILNFGSVNAALGKTTSVPIEKQAEGAKKVTIEMEIASVYQHSGVNRRFLNVLSDYEYDPTGGNSVYAETIYVDEDKYLDYMILVGDQSYVTDTMNNYSAPRTRFVTKYIVYYDDYSLANEQKLASDLQISSSQYDSFYVIFQSLGNIINASALMSSSIGFMSSFQFVSLFVLMVSILFYLVFLQELAIEKDIDSMTKIGIKSSQIESMKLLHEVYIVGIGFVVWLGINWLLQLVFQEKLLYVSEMFTYHRVIESSVEGIVFARKRLNPGPSV